MKAFEYLKSLIRANSLDSSKSFGLVISILVGALVGVTVCICLLIDVWRNDDIVTDLDSLGLFLLCAGALWLEGDVTKLCQKEIEIMMIYIKNHNKN